MKNSILESFLCKFQILTYSAQRIWKYLKYLSMKCIHVFPSHETIAKACDCHRSTVIRILKMFEELEWIFVKQRCFRSNLYYMPDELIQMDLDNPETFTRARLKATQDATENATENATPNATLYNVDNVIALKDVRLTKQTGTGNVQSSKDEKEQILQNIGIFGKDLWCLARFGYRALAMAIEDLKTRKASEPIRNLAAWLTNRCKHYQNKYCHN